MRGVLLAAMTLPLLLAGCATPGVSTTSDEDPPMRAFGSWPDDEYLASARQVVPDTPYLVVARPMTSRIVGVPQGGPDEIVLAEYYEVRFEIEQILGYGPDHEANYDDPDWQELERDDHVTVFLQAHARRWASHERYILFLDPRRIEEGRLIYWQSLTQLACPSLEAIEHFGIELDVGEPVTEVDDDPCFWP